MKQRAALVILLLALALTACDSYPVQSTLSPGQMVAAGNAAFTETAQVEAQWTQEAYRATQSVAQATQDEFNRQQAVIASQTAVAAQATHQAGTAQAVQATQAVQTMEARHTDAAYQATLGAAQTADAINYGSTATAAVSTQQALNNQAILDTAAMHAQETAVFAQAVVAEEAADRERQVNTVRAWAPFAGIGFAVAIILLLLWRWGNIEANRRRWIEKDARGDAPLRDDGRTIYDPDRNPGAALNLPDSRLIVALLQNIGWLPPGKELSAALIDQATTERDQMIDLAHRGLPDTGARRPQIPPALRQALEQPRFQVFGMHEQPPQLDAVTMQALENDWSEDDE